MSSPMPTAPEPGPGQAVIRIRYDVVTSHVADIVVTSTNRPTSDQLDALSTLLEATAQTERHPFTGAYIDPTVTGKTVQMRESLLMGHAPRTTSEEG